MQRRVLWAAAIAALAILTAGLSVICEADGALTPVVDRMEMIAQSIPSISEETRIRRSVAQATFCLPQNVLGILFYGALKSVGEVVHVGDMNEMRIVVVKSPIGVSLGRFIFLPEGFLTEEAVRHEYGHTLQGYRYGPFYLPLVGITSFVQAAISIVSPSYAAGYFDRWPENEANELGGVTGPISPADRTGSPGTNH